MLSRVGAALALALPLFVLPVVTAWAGPRDDPPIATVAGDDSYLADSTVSLTLNLDGSAGNGDLEQGQVDQAKAAAASVQGADAGAGASTGESAGSAGGAGGGSGSATAVAGECSFRQAILPAGDTRWGGNDPASGTLLLDPCNGPGVYVFVPNPAPGAPGAPAVAAPPPPPPPDPAVLAQQAYKNNFDPAYGSPYTWVGLNTWVWVNNWQPLQRTVDLRGCRRP